MNYLSNTFFDVEEPEVGTIAHRWWNGNIFTNPLSDYHSVSRIGLNTVGGSAGAIFSTSSDMATWYHALFSGQILNPSSMAELTSFVSTSSNTQKYGLGLTRETTFGLTYWGHGGDTWGYKSKMMYDTCIGTVVCGLSNSYPNGMTSIPFLLYRVVKNHIPGCLGEIVGSSNVCQGQNSVTYTVPPTSLANYYVWTLPSGATGFSNTNSISVNFGASAMSGTISVMGVNAYGSGAISSKVITINSLPSISILASSTTICTGQSAGLSASGATTYSWQPGSLIGNSVIVAPTNSTTYTITGASVNGCTSQSAQTILVSPCMTTLNLKMFFESYYSGGMMHQVLQNQGILGASNLATDTVLIELRNIIPPYTVVSSAKSIVHTNGEAVANLPDTGTYYIVIKHRNGLQTWSANPVNISSITNYDFSLSSAQAYGSNQFEIEPGVWAIFSGDLNCDENMDLLDLAKLETDILSFQSGYYATDLNGDGNVDLLDGSIIEDNINEFIYSIHP